MQKKAYIKLLNLKLPFFFIFSLKISEINLCAFNLAIKKSSTIQSEPLFGWVDKVLHEPHF